MAGEVGGVPADELVQAEATVLGRRPVFKDEIRAAFFGRSISSFQKGRQPTTEGT